MSILTLDAASTYNRLSQGCSHWCDVMPTAGLNSKERLPAADFSGTTFDTRRLAPLADGSATASSGGATVLATVVCEQLQQPLWKMRIHRPFLEVHQNCICMLSLSRRTGNSTSQANSACHRLRPDMLTLGVGSPTPAHSHSACCWFCQAQL